MLTAVEVRFERHALVVDCRETLLALRDDVVGLHTDGLHREHLLEPDTKRHDLEATAVGEGGPVPVHELAQPAGLVDDVGSRLQVQVVRIGEQRLRTEFLHGLGQHGLDRGLGSDGHERRRRDITVRCVDGAGSSEPVLEPGPYREDRLGTLVDDGLGRCRYCRSHGFNPVTAAERGTSCSIATFTIPRMPTLQSLR